MQSTYKKTVLLVFILSLSALIHGSQKFLEINKKQFSQEDKELFEFFSVTPERTYPSVYADNFLRKLEECQKNNQEFDEVKEKCKKVLTLIAPFWDGKYFSGASYKAQFMSVFLYDSWCREIKNVSLIEFLPSLLLTNSNCEVPFSDISKDPCVINELVYTYELKIRWDDLILRNLARQGFIMDGNFYEGKGSMPRAFYRRQTSESDIEYIKTMLKPKLSPRILLQQKTLLLCFKRLQKSSGQKMPRFVWLHHIFLRTLPDKMLENVEKLAEIPYNQRTQAPGEQWLLYELPAWYKEEFKKLVSKNN